MTRLILSCGNINLMIRGGGRMKKTVGMVVAFSLFLLLTTAIAAFAGGSGEGGEKGKGQLVGTRYEWTNVHGTFKLSERIANKVARGEQLVFVSSTVDPASPFASFVRVGIDRIRCQLSNDRAG
jgi:hypothetical protein